MPRQFDLDGMAVFITGAANGMGAGISRVLHEAGAAVVLTGRDLAALDRLAAELPGAVALPCDVTDEASVSDAVSQARKALPGHRWGLVNVAGGTGPGGKTTWEHTLDDVEQIFAVNVFGPFLTMKHFLPYMIEARAGSVVNVGGTYGFKGAPMSSAYGATKWALARLYPVCRSRGGAAWRARQQRQSRRGGRPPPAGTVGRAGRQGRHRSAAAV